MAVEISDGQLSFSIINTRMTVDAMRDSGYKSTTHALAELIDNSIEANASTIEVFGVSRYNSTTRRITLSELAVLDDGDGMDPMTLRGSLRFGHGTRRRRTGMGRFGMGLPNSSMSQARRVDVWSWQNGVTNALHTWLSIEDVERGAEEIPTPVHDDIPAVYLRASLAGFGGSGTLVVWKDLDRVEWKRASTTFKHTEALLGRIYRRFLASPSERLAEDDPRQVELGVQRSITCIPVEYDRDLGSLQTQRSGIVRVKPNDPLYLMTATSCPERFGPGPMFKELAASPWIIPIRYGGSSHEVRIRASYARPHVRNSAHDDATWPEEWIGKDAGNAPWGKHAAHNTGVSIVRAHREIEIDSSWTSGDTRERWWSVEVDLPTGLDEVVGITNNKQGALTLRRLVGFDWKREALVGEETPGDVRRRMEADGDSRIQLLDVQKQILRAITAVRSRAYDSYNPRSRHRVDDEARKADAKASAAIKRRIKEGHEGASDKAKEIGSPEEQKQLQVKSLTEKHHLDREDALERVAASIEADSRVRWIQSAQQSPAFFDVEPLPALVQVVVNTNHPVHSYLWEVIHLGADDVSDEEIRGRLSMAESAFRILIYSWARYEDEQTDLQRRRVRNARMEWGKYAEEFFDEEDETVPPKDTV